MAYDQDLADRIRGLVAERGRFTEHRMFGGLAFLIRGHMAVAASGEGGIMVRVDPVETQRLIDETDADPMIMRGSRSRGWVRVAADHLTTDEALADWIDVGVAYARTLPPKR